jgi:hypothetical protein
MNSTQSKRETSANLRNQLERYSRSARPRVTLATIKRQMGNWPAYAAASGSALAMATSASAGIIYSGPISITASAPGSSTLGNASKNQRSFQLGIAPRFDISVAHDALSGVAFGGYSPSHKLPLLHETSPLTFKGSMVTYRGHSVFNLKKLSFGDVISAGAGRFSGGSVLKEDNVLFPTKTQRFTFGEWVPNQPAFEGLRFATNLGQTDYGWAELKFGVNGNGLPDSVTLLGMAYNSSGGSITAGETPEPGTAVLMLLALGAAGVAVLRKQRQKAEQRPE